MAILIMSRGGRVREFVEHQILSELDENDRELAEVATVSFGPTRVRHLAGCEGEDQGQDKTRKGRRNGRPTGMAGHHHASYHTDPGRPGRGQT